jgi:hypothetical protein
MHPQCTDSAEQAGRTTRGSGNAVIAPKQKSNNNNDGDLTPNPDYFRIVEGPYHQTETISEFVCLPRKVSTESADEDVESPDALSSADGCHVGSIITGRTAKYLKSQLVIVKMHTTSKALRRERDILEVLHNLKGSEAFIGSYVWSETLFPEASESFLCMRPIFGKTLYGFGKACLKSRLIPTYFVWHILLGLMDALDFIHDAGIAHGALTVATAVLRCDAPRGELQHRDYPDIVLTGFGAAAGQDGDGEFEDCFNLVWIMYARVITRWSDIVTLMRFVNMDAEQSTPLLRLAQAFKTMMNAASNGQMEATVKDLKKEWEDIAVTEREKGPDECPEWIKFAAYDDVATGEDLEAAAQPPLVLNFGADSDKFRTWVRERREPVALRKRTKKNKVASLLVFKFRNPESHDALDKLGHRYIIPCEK